MRLGLVHQEELITEQDTSKDASKTAVSHSIGRECRQDFEKGTEDFFLAPAIKEL